jgi:hypothetical protein
VRSTGTRSPTILIDPGGEVVYELLSGTGIVTLGDGNGSSGQSTVVLLGHRHFTDTERDGTFRIRNIPGGEATLCVVDKGGRKPKDARFPGRVRVSGFNVIRIPITVAVGGTDIGVLNVRF